MKYAVEMGPGVVIYIPIFIKIDTGINGGTHREHGDCISILSFFKNKERS
jgi:hypothetical protein